MLTLAPTITWSHEGADGGDLITAAYTLGIPHPTGYPTYVLLAKLFTFLPWGDVAFRVNLMSAFLAAGTVALLYLSLFSLLDEGRAGRATASVIAAAASLAFGFSPVFWSQATIAEVYALNSFFAAWLIYLLLKLRAARSGKERFSFSALFAFSFGLALGNHLSIILLAPGGLFFLWKSWRVRRIFELRELPLCLLAFILGLAVYLYLPLRAVHTPPVNWGAPYTWPRFWWVLSGQLYGRFLFTLPWTYLPGRVSAWVGLLARQFAWWGLPVGLVGMWDLCRRERDAFLASLIFFLLISTYAVGYNTTDSYVYLLPAFMVFALWMGRGLHLSLSDLHRYLPVSTAGPGWRRAFLAGVLLLPFISLGLNFPSLDLSADYTAHDYGVGALEAAAPGAVIISSSDAHTFALWYFRYAEGRREDVAILNAGLLQYDWYVENVRHLHPGLAMLLECPTCLEKLLAANLPFRPVYLTDPALLPGRAYSLRPAWPLYQVIGRD